MTPSRISANLGFLWADRPLPQAIRAAAAAGFDAVECHFPYAEDREAVLDTLAETGLPMLGLNTRKGEQGENGLAALPDRERDARAAIEEALTWAAALGARHVHVMAGAARGPEAEAAFRANLVWGAERAAERGLMLVIEPLNPHDAPGYFLRDTGQAEALLRELARPELRLMFDCYHVQRTEGDLTARLRRLLPLIGHVQIAGAPDRGRPDQGEIAYERLIPALRAMGYDGWIGAEYRPEGPEEDTLGWLDALRRGANVSPPAG
ncbi:MAG: hydroxypyruvate isomerase family protein [Pseudomonadota bacterium]